MTCRTRSSQKHFLHGQQKYPLVNEYIVIILCICKHFAAICTRVQSTSSKLVKHINKKPDLPNQGIFSGCISPKIYCSPQKLKPFMFFNSDNLQHSIKSLS